MGKKVLVAALVLLALGFAWFVWPTPIAYFEANERLFRVNRLTGETWRAGSVGGWQPVRWPEPSRASPLPQFLETVP